MMGFGMMGAFGLIGLLFSAAVIVGIVLLVVWAVRQFPSQGNRLSRSESGRDILQARYARGEITREQYQEMMKDLA